MAIRANTATPRKGLAGRDGTYVFFMMKCLMAPVWGGRQRACRLSGAHFTGAALGGYFQTLVSFPVTNTFPEETEHAVVEKAVGQGCKGSRFRRGVAGTGSAVHAGRRGGSGRRAGRGGLLRRDAGRPGGNRGGARSFLCQPGH